MNAFSLKTRNLLIAALGLSFAAFACAGAYAGQKKVHVTKAKPKKKSGPDTSQSAEPDKVLYEKAQAALKGTKYTEARLDLQTLINTYPDSEYLAKAKLSIADSYYKEGGTSNLTQAVDEYKNFIVFFPFLDEAAYAQMQVAMCHYRMMEKSDRDNSQAESAEDEFRTFLLKYPQSPLISRAEQNLRNVQEVLADGEFRIARFYYISKKDYRASAARLVELTTRYPLYSQSDDALWMLGDVYMRAKQVSKNEDDKNHWADLAGQCYSRIAKDYPLSKFAPDAKARLTGMGMATPKPDPDALARMQKQQAYESQHHPNRLEGPAIEMFKATPDVHMAARVGEPNLNPPDDTVSATEVLNQGAAGPRFNISVAPVSTGGGDAAAGDTESVDSSDSSSAANAAPTTGAAAQVIAAPGAESGETAPTDGAATAPSTMTSLSNGTQTGSTESSTMTSLPPANAGAANDQPAVIQNSAPATGEPANALAATSGAASSPAPASKPASNSSANSATNSQAADKKDDSKNESSSKKKKGLHKLIP